MPWHTVIRMVCVVASQVAGLEQDSPTDIVISSPLFIRGRLDDLNR